MRVARPAATPSDSKSASRVPTSLNSPKGPRVIAGKMDTPVPAQKTNRDLSIEERLALYKVNKFIATVKAQANRKDRFSSSADLSNADEAFISRTFKLNEFLTAIKAMCKKEEFTKAVGLMNSLPKEYKEIKAILYPSAEFWVLLAEVKEKLGDKPGALEAIKKGISHKSVPLEVLKGKLEVSEIKLRQEIELKSKTPTKEEKPVEKKSSKVLTPMPLEKALAFGSSAPKQAFLSTPQTKIRSEGSSMTPISDKLKRSLNLIDQEKSEVEDSPVPKTLLSQLENVTIHENQPLEPVMDFETPSKSGRSDNTSDFNMPVKLEEFLGNDLGAEVQHIASKAKSFDLFSPTRKSAPVKKLSSQKDTTPKPKQKIQTSVASASKETIEKGSVIMLQTVRATPKKQLEHDTDFILSPVRRSARLAKENEAQKNNVDGRKLDALLEKSNFTYAPNPALHPIQEVSTFHEKSGSSRK
jgi:hypothetical protein